MDNDAGERSMTRFLTVPKLDLTSLEQSPYKDAGERLTVPKLTSPEDSPYNDLDYEPSLSSAAADRRYSGHIEQRLEEALRPDPGREYEFETHDNKFAFSVGQLNKMFNPKSIEAFVALGGLAGLEKGLRTNLVRGLDDREEQLEGEITFEEAVNASTVSNNSSDRPNTELSTTETRSTAFPTGRIVPWESALTDRKRRFGENRLPHRKQRNVIKLLGAIFFDYLVWALLISVVPALGLSVHLQAHNDPHASPDAAGRHDYPWQEYTAIMGLVSLMLCLHIALERYKIHRKSVIEEAYDNSLMVLVIRSG